MTNISVDVGNSRIKLGIFNLSTLMKVYAFSDLQELDPILVQPHDNIIVSSVKESAKKILEKSEAKNKKIELTPLLNLPLTICYSTPNSLGVDRIADACGALQLFPGEDCLVIDLGTCINYEWIDKERNYWGGMISPGVTMRFTAMHTFTARLPLVEAIHNPRLIGDSTISCLQSGVMNGILEEMNGTIERAKSQYPKLRVIITGGDGHFFENQMKHSIFAAPELGLIGLNGILMHNVAQ